MQKRATVTRLIEEALTLLAMLYAWQSFKKNRFKDVGEIWFGKK